MAGDDVIKKLRVMVSKSGMGRIKFADGKSISVDITTAKAILKVYDALGDSAKKKFAERIGESKEWFLKIVDFCWKQFK